MHFTIFIPKETRAEDHRVSLVPNDVKTLVAEGHRVFVESAAGIHAGFSDQAYQETGAHIRVLNGNNLEAYRQLLQDIEVVVRVKRPARDRERLENQAMATGTIMLGALDPLERHSDHIEEYQRAGMVAYSLDQFALAADDPMNILSAMSQLAGRLALLDALQKHPSPVQKIVIIGYGVVGQAAAREAQRQGLTFTVIVSQEKYRGDIKQMGGNIVLLDRNLTLAQQQDIVKATISDADIVITSARQANRPAPLLIPQDTLLNMRRHAVIVDMALSEGGNVEGAEHDATHRLGNDVIVTNVSGYPKAMPLEASIAWSKASLHAIQALARQEHRTWPKVGLTR